MLEIIFKYRRMYGTETAVFFHRTHCEISVYFYRHESYKFRILPPKIIQGFGACTAETIHENNRKSICLITYNKFLIKQ